MTAVALMFALVYDDAVRKDEDISPRGVFIFKHKYIFLSTNECTRYYLNNNIKIYIKLSPTCFGVVTPSSVNSLSLLAKVTLC